jgi:hypothetical protein
MSEGRPQADPSAEVLGRMLEDARALAQLEDDPVLAPRCSLLIAFLSDTLALKDPQWDIR